jgi:hypothetical protein
MNLDVTVNAPQAVTVAVKAAVEGTVIIIPLQQLTVRPTAPHKCSSRHDTSCPHPRPQPGLARRARARVRVARLAPLFNFTRGVPKGYLISWMGDSSNTHTVSLFSLALNTLALILSLLQ